MTLPRAGVSLRALVLTPERISTFIIPSSLKSPLLFRSPRAHRDSSDRTRLLGEDHDSPGSSDTSPDNRRWSTTRTHPAPSATRPPRFLRLPSPGAALRLRLHRSVAREEDDTDLSTRAAMSLPHVEKVTTPYGFRAVLAASPCTRRRESLFHNKSPAVKTPGAESDTGVSTEHELRKASLNDSKRDDHQVPAGSGCASGESESKLDDAPPTTPGASRIPTFIIPSSSPGSPLGHSHRTAGHARPVRAGALGVRIMRELNRPVAALKALTPARRRKERP